MVTKIQILILVLMTSAMASAPAWAVEHATTGQDITGSFLVYSEYRPEPGLLDVGYVEVFVRDEVTHNVVVFRAEDSNCALYSNYFKVSVCSHVYEKPFILRLKKLPFGTRLQISQTVSYADVFTPRFTYRAL